ncbi:MAG: pyrroloquinoline quinone biosynthesis protein PqqB [Bacteroidetes bacterium]|nr:MAG: pyrroloquinoline quinone biosynthesis protein PqqB [Bacteroidota bacterium]
MITSRIIFCLVASSLFQSAVILAQNVPQIVILGIGQDAGYPQADCHKECCEAVWANPELKRHVSCIAVVDKASSQSWMFDATPDFTTQVKMLEQYSGKQIPDGILLTHAHIGHYTGLMYLGREAIGATDVPVYAMPRMYKFLSENGPWSQLVTLNNIVLRQMKDNSKVKLTTSLSVTPLLVPHRDEYSETVGFLITGPNKTVLFIPDINKWQSWDRSILEVIREVDIALIDGSFFNGDELPGRDMSEIPHPFVVESMELFESLSPDDKAKVHFIHFNHTNPMLHADSEESQLVKKMGFNIAFEGQVIGL